jgi:hypothetical protein
VIPKESARARCRMTGLADVTTVADDGRDWRMLLAAGASTALNEDTGPVFAYDVGHEFVQRPHDPDFAGELRNSSIRSDCWLRGLVHYDRCRRAGAQIPIAIQWVSSPIGIRNLPLGVRASCRRSRRQCFSICRRCCCPASCSLLKGCRRGPGPSGQRPVHRARQALKSLIEPERSAI